MAYSERLRMLFHRPSKSFQAIMDRPSFSRSSILIIIGSVIYSTIAEFGLFNDINAHFIAAYALMFTILWFLPTFLSMVFFRTIRKRFNTESYMEAGALSLFSVATVVFIFLVAFMIYSNFFAEPRRAVYFAVVYGNQLLPFMIVGAVAAIMTIHRALAIGRLIVNARIYQTVIVWLVAGAITMYVAYLLFRGWL